MRKTVIVFVFLLTAPLLFAACGGSDPAPTPTPTAAATATTAPAPATLAPATATSTTVAAAAPTLVPTVNAITTTKSAPTPASQGNAEQGQALFVTTCAACHGPQGEGVKGLGKDMTTSKFIAGLSDSDLLAFIKQGRATTDPLNTTGVMMPPKGGNPALTDQELLDIIAYIRTIHK